MENMTENLYDIPTTKKECEELLVKILSNKDDYLNPEFSKKYHIFLESWLGYAAKLGALIDTLDRLEKQKINLRELLNKGYLQ